jgi:hypothetical protein
MAQAVSRRPVIGKAGFVPWSVHVGFMVDTVALGQVYLRVLRFSPVNIIPPSLSVLVYRLGMNNRPIGGRSSETSSHPIDMNNNNNNIRFLFYIQDGPKWIEHNRAAHRLSSPNNRPTEWMKGFWKETVAVYINRSKHDACLNNILFKHSVHTWKKKQRLHDNDQLVSVVSENNLFTLRITLWMKCRVTERYSKFYVHRALALQDVQPQNRTACNHICVLPSRSHFCHIYAREITEQIKNGSRTHLEALLSFKWLYWYIIVVRRWSSATEHISQKPCFPIRSPTPWRPAPRQDAILSTYRAVWAAFGVHMCLAAASCFFHLFVRSSQRARLFACSQGLPHASTIRYKLNPHIKVVTGRTACSTINCLSPAVYPCVSKRMLFPYNVFFTNCHLDVLFFLWGSEWMFKQDYYSDELRAREQRGPNGVPRNYFLISYLLLQSRLFYLLRKMWKESRFVSRLVLYEQVPHMLLTSTPCCRNMQVFRVDTVSHTRCYSGRFKITRNSTVICAHLNIYTVIWAHLNIYTVICAHLNTYTVICAHLNTYTVICAHLNTYTVICAHLNTYTVICAHFHKIYIWAYIMLIRHLWTNIGVQLNAVKIS